MLEASAELRDFPGENKGSCRRTMNHGRLQQVFFFPALTAKGFSLHFCAVASLGTWLVALLK